MGFLCKHIYEGITLSSFSLSAVEMKIEYVVQVVCWTEAHFLFLSPQPNEKTLWAPSHEATLSRD